MGWEGRQRGGSYYVQKRRRGEKVTSRYIGGGLLGSLAAQEDQQARERSEQARRRTSDARREAESQDAEIHRLCSSVREFSRLWLETAGYYKHHGQWRKREAHPMRPAAKPMDDHLKKLYLLASKGDRKAAGELFAAWEDSGELPLKLDRTYEIIFSYTDARAEKNLILRAAIDKKAKELRESLGQPGDTGLESLLIEQVIVCFLSLGDASASQMKRMLEGSGIEEATFRDRMVDRAQKRYLLAVRELGIARRLRLPAKEAGQDGARLRTISGGKATMPAVVEEAA
jgi:hypothetical protein